MPRLRRRTAPALGVLLIASALGACSSGGGGPAAPTAEPPYTLEAGTRAGPFSAGVTTVQLVDNSRATQANRDFPGSPDRRMTLEVWYPANAGSAAADSRDATLDAGGAPYPLIVFAHGLTSSRVQSTTYTRHLASHGYIVAAPDFPLTNSDAPGGPSLGDLANQPADVSFVIDQMLKFNGEHDGRFGGVIQPDAIGLTGHSFGGFTSLLTVYGPNRDSRIRAVVPLSATGCILDAGAVADTNVPIMLITGSADLIVPASESRRAYELANAPKYWVELNGGSHVRFADADIDDAAILAAVARLVSRLGASAAPADAPIQLAGCTPRTGPTGTPIGLARQQELLRTFATPFFDAYLRDSDAARRFLQEELPGLTRDSAQYEFDVTGGG